MKTVLVMLAALVAVPVALFALLLLVAVEVIMFTHYGVMPALFWGLFQMAVAAVVTALGWKAYTDRRHRLELEVATRAEIEYQAILAGDTVLGMYGRYPPA